MLFYLSVILYLSKIYCLCYLNVSKQREFVPRIATRIKKSVIKITFIGGKNDNNYTFNRKIRSNKGDIVMKIEIEVDDYIYLLDARRNFVAEHYNWKIPDCLWDYFCEVIEECGVGSNANPNYIVDNAIVNGDYGDFDEYKDTDESDEDFIERVKDDVFYINPTERIVCYSI